MLRGLRHRNTIIALTVFAVSAQVFRNWLVLRGIGVDVSVFDSMALLVATAALGLLPVGPSLGVATTVLILGSQGGRADGGGGSAADRDRRGRGDAVRLLGAARPLAHARPCRPAVTMSCANFASTAVLGELVTGERCDRRG